jgi:23S rRNA (adenine2030-N6)-methyltransferase
MLSYRHAFHAGNAGDVLKHAVLAAALDLLLRKDRPLCYLDCHAGAGRYDLADARAAQTGEHLGGIRRVWGRTDVPAGLLPYLEAVRALNPDGALRHYPGSPMVAATLLRPTDRLVLMELNANDCDLLRAAFRGDARVAVHRRNGYEGLPALVPPPERRGLALLDPSYEVASDYADVVAALISAHRRWAEGCYIVWYPVLERRPAGRLERALVATGLRRVLCAELTVDLRDGPGMKGAGMLLVNPPWTLEERLRELLPWLQLALAANGGTHRLEWLAGE